MRKTYFCSAIINQYNGDMGNKQWRETIKFAFWTMTVILVCFLLSKVIVRQHTQYYLPLTGEGRDSLMTVAVPRGLCDTLIGYEAFAVHFNGCRGIANCAAYELLPDELLGQAERAGEFMQDVAVEGCPAPADYAGSGMDRGHLVPAADLKWNAMAMRQSFFLTNVAPMHKGLNEGNWAKLEEKVREWAARDSGLLVFTGPVICDRDTTLASGHVKVPGAYYKIIMAPCVRPRRVIAFIYPNGSSAAPLRQHAVSVDEVERRTGLDFFPLLLPDEQRRLESKVNLAVWIN